MKTKLISLSVILIIILVAGILSDQRQRELAQVERDIETLLTDAESLNAQVDKIIESIDLPGLDWQWAKAPGGDWDPTEYDLIMMQSMIQPFLDQGRQSRNEDPYDWDEVAIVYQGKGNNKRYIRLTGYCGDAGRFSDEELVQMEVLDGGSCIFHAKFDPYGYKFYDLDFNGEA